MGFKYKVKTIGLLWQLLIPSMLAAIICIVAVQAWTLSVSQQALEDRMDSNLNLSLTLLKTYLSQRGTIWAAEAGKLHLGAYPAFELTDLVDQAAKASDGVVTIFSGDQRVATNVRKADGSRAVGTRLSDDAVRDTVMRQGVTYRGEANILGQRYRTIYEPIHDAAGGVIGILFVGLPTAELDAVEREVIRQGALAGLLVMLAFAAVSAWLISRTLGPLDGLAVAMRNIAAGELTIPIPGTERRDQVGRMSEALQIFRDAALAKLRLEKETSEARREREEQRAAAEAQRVDTAARQSAVVNLIGEGLDQLSQGNLTICLDEPFPVEFDKLRIDLNATSEKLCETMVTIDASMQAIHSSTKEIGTSAADLARRTGQQAVNLEQTAAALDEVTATVKKTAEGAANARQIVAAAKANAEQSEDVARKTAEAMKEIERSSKKIGEIIGVMDEIAFQTNLLALNAGVEAARAGDSGRGFAVVAAEVRALAQRSAEAAKEIKGHISTSTSHVVRGVTLVTETSNSLQRIMTQVSDINDAVGAIAAGAKEQSMGLDEINKAINEMDQVTQQNAAMVEETTGATESLMKETIEMAGLISKFHLEDRANSSRGTFLQNAACAAKRTTSRQRMTA